MNLAGCIQRIANSRPLGRLLRWVNTRCRPRRPVPIRMFGQTVHARSLDRIAALLLWRRGGGEDFEVALWRSLIRPGMVVADVGANLGVYTLLAAKRVGAEGCVHCFEPDPDNFALLTRNVRANGHENVICHQAAVADEVGEVTLLRRPEHHGDHRIYGEAVGGREAIRVPLTTLDAVVGESGRLDVVKLDIQGVEGRAVAGMEGLLRANPQIRIVCEFWPAGLRAAGSEPRAFLGRLGELGLTVRHIDGRRRALERLKEAELLAAAESRRFTNVLLSRS